MIFEINQPSNINNEPTNNGGYSDKEKLIAKTRQIDSGDSPPTVEQHPQASP